MLVYGKNVAREILSSDKKVLKVYLEEGFNDKSILSLLENKKISVKRMSKRDFLQFDKFLNQGIVLDIGDFDYVDLENFYKKDIVVVLDHLEDPHNFGAIIRTCEAAGITSIVIPKDRSVEVNSTVMKTSSGALNNVDICRVTNLTETIKKLKKENFWVVGTDMDANESYKVFKYPEKCVLVIGSEGKGISRQVLDNCDFLVKIPMFGKINSLNASVAAAIVLYEVVTQTK